MSTLVGPPWQTKERIATHRPPDPPMTRNITGGEEEPLIIGTALLRLVKTGMITHHEALVAAAVVPYQFSVPGRNYLDLAAVFHCQTRRGLSVTVARRMRKTVDSMIARMILRETDGRGSLAITEDILAYAVPHPGEPFCIRTLLQDCLPPNE